MADFVSPIVDIISRLWPSCARHTRYLRKLQENKNLLRNVMDELKEARDDVQRRVVEAEEDTNEPKKRTDQVDEWLKRVQNIEGEVEKILEKPDEQQQQLSRTGKCFGGCCPACPSNKCWGNYKLGKSIAKKMIPLVDDLKRNGHFEVLTYNLPLPPVQDMNLEPTVGMESMFDEVWRLITSKDDNPVRIMGLHGHGGVGKTTLLEKINNEFYKSSSSEHGFDHVVIFVVVSKPINYEAIQKTIGKRLKLSSLQEDEVGRATEIFNVLRNKKYVILLDDIWERVDLRRIGIPSPLSQGNSSSSSSKVIFTTRSKEVCGRMDATHTFQVACLPWDKAWRLFQDKVGEATLSSISRQGAGELVELVAKECGGLPLALITIGRAMSARKSAEEWKDALRTLRNSASEFQGMSDEVLPRLKLSYDNLPDETIKSCFLYCALYPEDHRIKIAQLIDYWIGEGFLNEFDDKLDEARNHGFTIIETLKRACLLEESEVEFSGVTEVKMHDVIRDLALWIVNGCKSSSSKTTGKFLVVASNINNTVCERWRNAERIFWMVRVDEYVSEEPPTSSNLRTLIVVQHPSFSFDNKTFCLPQNFFQFMPSLRVLDLSNTDLLELPTSIGELSELQYLGLSNTWIKELPVELRKLVNLKFLDLTRTLYLTKIPAGVIANLSELQVLKLAASGFTNWELKEKDGRGLSFGELDRLKQLQELGITINTSLAALEKLLLCNQKLRMVCTDLCCKHMRISLPSSSSSSSISEGGLGLRNLKRLQYDSIRCSSVELEKITLSIINGAASASASSGGLLKNININNNVYAFQNLDTIRIIDCDELKDLTWVVYVDNLKTLIVFSCDKLETIIIELSDGGLEGTAGRGRGRRGGVFGRLETLSMSFLPKLESIYRHALAFPSIETIYVYECPRLKKLPLDSGSNVNNTLKWIKGTSTKWWNELEWEDETINSKFLPYYKEAWV